MKAVAHRGGSDTPRLGSLRRGVVRRAALTCFPHTKPVFLKRGPPGALPTHADALLTIFQMAEADTSETAAVARDGRATSVAGDGGAPAAGQPPPWGPGPTTMDTTTPTDLHVVPRGRSRSPNRNQDGAVAPGTTADGAPTPEVIVGVVAPTDARRI